MDSHTPEGQRFIQLQRDTQKVLESRGYRIIEMINEASKHDIIIASEKDGVLKANGIAEIKCREMFGDTPIRLSHLNGGYLISYRKLTYGATASELFGIPYFVIANIIPERCILIWKLAEDGKFLFEFPVRESQSKKSCNGGVATRMNAYLPIDKAYELKY